MICDCLPECLCRFRVNSPWSQIGRFWAKGLGYSPWFWTWPIFGKSWKSLQTLWNTSKTVLILFVTASATVCVDLGWIGNGRKLADFEQKTWALAHGFELGRFWQILEIAQTLWNDSKTVLKLFVTAFATVFVAIGWIRRGRKLADFDQKAFALAHGFEHCRFWQVLQIAPNTLKRLQNRSKMICDCFRDCLCGFRVYS